MVRFRGLPVPGVLTLLATLGCHSDSYLIGPRGATGPFSDVIPIRLTFNTAAQYYWPRFTQDGKGILYQFSQERRGDDDRCLGLILDGGSSAIWQMCENRLAHADSSDSYGAFALDSTGRLLYLAATSARGKLGLERVTLFLADTSDPLRVRRALLTLPHAVGGVTVDWLSDAVWTGRDEFYARADEYRLWPHQPRGGQSDSLPVGLMVVKGTIAGDVATLTPVPGTENVRSWSLADGGKSIAFVRRSSSFLLKVPLAGGVPDTVAEIPRPTARYILAVGCGKSACYVSSSTFDPPPASNWGPFVPEGIFSPIGVVQLPSLGLLQRISLSDGQVSTASTGPAAAFWTAMTVSPRSGNIVVESGKPPATTLLLFPGVGQ